MEESEKLLVETRQRSRKLFGPEHPYTLHLQHVLARVLAQAGRLDEAEKLSRDTLEVRRLTTPASEATGRLLLVLGQVLAQKERPDEAEPLLQEAQALFREHYAVKPELAAMAANWLGAIQSARHAYPEAEALLLSNSDSFFSPEAEMSPQERGLAVGHIVKHYENWGKPSEAAKWKAKLNALAQTQLNAKVQ